MYLFMLTKIHYASSFIDRPLYVRSIVYLIYFLEILNIERIIITGTK